MCKWIEYFSNQKPFHKKANFSKDYPNFSPSIDQIVLYLHKKSKWQDLQNHLNYLNKLPIITFQSREVSSLLIMVENHKKVMIKKFFYDTLVQKFQNEFHTYLLGLSLLYEHLCEDLSIDLHSLFPSFLAQRKIALYPEEFSLLYGTLKEDTVSQKAFLFLNLIHYQKINQVSSLEKKIIRDCLGVSYTKRLLGLKKNDYKYLESKPDLSNQNSKQLEIYYKVKEEISINQIDFLSYTQNYLKDKKIISWCWWMISPFLASDVSTLLHLISEAKKIKRVYIDLCTESEKIYQDYIQNKDIKEETIEKEIKKIYPPTLKNFQKEIFPYEVLLEKLKFLSIPVKCFGFNGIDLINKEPILIKENNILDYPIDQKWKKALYQEYQNIDQLKENEIIVYFHFMKPMFFFPPNLQDSRIEKIIHTDQFTGFGSQKPENALAIYSWYHSSASNSFIYPDIKKASFKNENIIHFPKINDQIPKLNYAKFNQFKLYDTMIYSSKSNEGDGEKDFVENPNSIFTFSS